MLVARLARVVPSSEKINIDFVCEIVNFSSPNLIIFTYMIKR